MRGTLGTLLRTTLTQLGGMRDLALDQARSQRMRLDTALLQRRLRDTLAALGEAVYELAASGQLGELEEVPEIADCLIELEELEQRIVEMEERSRAPMPAPEPAGGSRGRARWSKSRRSSGGRGGGGRGGGGGGGGGGDPEPRVWRPNLGDDDGTVSAFGGDALDDDPLDDDPAPRKRSRSRSRGRSARARGGIEFVNDDPIDPEEDLSNYMHEDDVVEGDQ